MKVKIKKFEKYFQQYKILQTFICKSNEIFNSTIFGNKILF